MAENRPSISLPIGGMYSAGDAAAIPEGYCRLVRNHLHRPGRLDARPPFVYDSVMSVQGLFLWEDITNQATRLGSLDGTVNLRLKAASGETWGSTISASGTRMTDFANYLGKVYIMADNGSGSPATALSFDGTNVSSAPFTSAIVSRTVTAFKERLYLCYPRVTVTLLNATAANCYATPSPSNGNVAIIVVSGTTLKTVYPTSLTTACQFTDPVVVVATNASEKSYVVRRDFRNQDPLNDVPLTYTITCAPASPYDELTTLRSTAVTVGQLGRVAADSILHRCTTAGTTAVGAPAFTTTLGATTTDGTATWTAERSTTLAQHETLIPNLTTTKGQWSSYHFKFTLPYSTNSIAAQAFAKFGNTSVPNVLALNPIDISYQDGLADGDARKQNYGWQSTLGDFYYPFVNTETAVTSTQNLEMIVWTEIGQNVIRGANYMKLNEVAGLPTASIMGGNRLVVFKRRGIWQFSVTSDPDTPLILSDQIIRDVGCIGPRALDQIDGEIFFIGDNEIYRFIPGDAPRPICGEAMREEIMAKGSGWVESATTYKMPILAIDQKNREVWVYTQAGILYCYNLAQKAWSKHDVSNSAPVQAMLYYPGTQQMYVAFGGYGLTRLTSATTVSNDTIDNTANTYSGTVEVAFRALEQDPERVDYTAERAGIYHLATAAQSTDVVTAYWSTDRGSTYTGNYPFTLNLNIPVNYVPVWRNGPSVLLKVTKTGRLGATAWSINKANMKINVHRGEWPSALPTANGTPDFA